MKCQFHPTKAAENYCGYCEINVCGACSDELSNHRNQGSSVLCFICRSGLEPLAEGSQITPFWSRIGEIYKYPLSLQAIITIVLIAALSTLMQGLGMFSASGENEAPTVDACFKGSVAPVIYVGLISVVATFAAVTIFYKFGDGMGIISSFILALVLPAAIIIVAVEERLFPALNPVGVLGVIKATGISYFVMVLFIVVMLSSMGLLSSLFSGEDFSSFGLFFTSLIANYYSVVVYHIMGYLVYQNHAELGYSVSGKAGIKNSKERSAKQRQSAKLEILIKAGEFEAAREVAKESLRNNSSVWEWGRAIKLFCAGKPSEDLEKYFERYVDKLSNLDEVGKIADMYLELVRAKPTFEPTKDSQKLTIANALHHIGKDVLAIKLVQKLPLESNKKDIVEGSLNLLINSFKRLPGGEKHVSHFKSLLHSQSIT